MNKKILFYNTINANNQFAIDYYTKLKENEVNNIFFSPLSISSVFAMAYEGAKGQTAEEIKSVFYFTEDEKLRRNKYASLLEEFNKENEKYNFKVANALWAQKDYLLSEEYLNNIVQYYKGKVANLDFIKEPEKSRTIINKWIEDKTNNKIKNLIPPDTIDNLTRLILANAIYFKGSWAREFNPKETRRDNFRKNNQEIIGIDMMRCLDEKTLFNYGENNILQMLEIPYSGNELSALFLLPKNDDLARLENLLSLSNLANWKKEMKKQVAYIYIPKFKFETKYFMSEALKVMGMSLAFTDSADFSGMTAENIKDLYISEAIHQTFIAVDEQGAEVAAATASVSPKTGLVFNEPKFPIFRADHPFLFLIQHKETGNIIFIGRVVNPSL